MAPDTTLNAAPRDGVRLCWSDRGRGEPAVLLLHGWCLDHTWFAPQIEHFSRTRRVVSPDLRGFGASAQPQQAYSLDVWADDVLWLIERLALERPVLIGHSLGGAIALAAAVRRPDTVSALALLDPAIVLRPSTRAYFQHLAAGLSTPDPEPAARQLAAGCTLDSDTPERTERFVARILATPPHVREPGFRSCFEPDTDALVARCTTPLLLIDSALPLPDRERMARLCPHLERTQTPDAGHFHHLERPQEVHAALERFLPAPARTLQSRHAR
jgi:pimeloyl-ACP methyl ester carboxylesterase